MSGQSSIISLDLTRGQGNILDIAQMFPLSEPHALRTTKPILDTLRRGKGTIYDFSLGYTLTLKRFRTLVTLDLSTPELWKPSLLTTRILSIRPRFQTIDLVPPLEIPFGSLDMRSLRPILSKRTYPDIYKRTLPASLHIRREWRNIRTYVKSKRKPIIATGIGILVLSLPALLYSKMLIEDGYARLASLRSLGDRASIIASIRESSRDFERANILFMPFRIIPSDQIRLGAIAIDGGLSLSRALKALVESLPDTRTSTTAMIVYSVEDTTTPTYRAKARDISPLVPLGIDIPTDWLEKNSATLSYLESSLTDAAQAFARVEKLDDPRKESILHVSRAFSELARILDFYQSHHSDILTMLGHTDPQRYIVFDQNRDEIRANGGFPGSVITFTLYKGNILDYRTDDIYYYDWNLYPYKELPPPGIALISGNYGLRDVNYYPDFRETLERANSFVERSGDATLTTGIAIHQGIIEDILKSV